MTTPARTPERLLAIDLGVLDRYGDDLEALARHLSAVRHDTLVVFGGTGGHRLPEPDYRLIDGVLTRHPGAETVESWQGGSGVSIADAAEHLAEALLIPPSQASVVTEHPRVFAPMTGVAPAETVEALVSALERTRPDARPGPALVDLAFDRAQDTLRRNIADLGFTAASVGDNRLGAHDGNYAAVWARDGIVTGLWTMALGDEFVDAFRATVSTLVRHQTPAGQIPANVRLDGDRPEYSGIGGIASIDSVLWFVIGAVRLAFHLQDPAFTAEVSEPIDRAMRWLAAHDSNNDGLIEIPESSDWMDLFPRSYNVLYDEVLWHQACHDAARFAAATGGDGDTWSRTADRVGHAIGEQFWPTGEQLMEIAGSSSGRFTIGEASYLLSQVTPFDYGWRCDVYGNLLAALAGLLDERRSDRLFRFLWGVGVNLPYPAASLYPAIHSGADDWKDYFLVNFLNLPGHYHNGGIWPLIGGLWVRFLAQVGREELAHRELAALAEACRQGSDGEWEFSEWLHGETGRPMGKRHQAWSAASYVGAYLAVKGEASPAVFPDLPEGVSLP